jgi:TPR repeat protein
MKTRTILLHGRLLSCFPLMLLSLSALHLRGVEFDLEKVKAGVEKGDGEAEYQLGRAYHRGEGVPLDYAKALELYRKAAEQGNAGAQNNLASMYANGTGVNRDAAEAVKWLRKAAVQGNAKAQDNLGMMIGRGMGVPKNRKESMEWYRKAAEQGLAEAELHLGQLYYLELRRTTRKPPNGFPRPPSRGMQWRKIPME